MRSVFQTEDRKVIASIRSYNAICCSVTCIALVTIFVTDALITFPVWTLRCLSLLFVLTNFLLFCWNLLRDAEKSYWRWESHLKLQIKVKKYIRAVAFLMVSFAIFHIVPVLLGAPILTDVLETATFSMLLTAMIAFPGCLLFGCDVHKWLHLILGSGPQTSWENNWIKQTSFILIGAWLGAFVIPLDWDRPWQIWPICCTYSTLFFSALGHFNNFILSYKTPTKKGK